MTVNFISQQNSNTDPFLAVIAPPAPHQPATPAQRHQGVFKDQKAPRTPNFNHPNNVLDKHWLLRMKPQTLSEDAIQYIDELHRNRWESLLAVDELVEATVSALKQAKQLDNTYIIFTSDNGYHLGQFGQAFDKRLPYETDIRIPLIIRGPQIPSNRKLKYPVGLHDLTPTILDMANVKIPDFIDGESIRAKLESVSTSDTKFERYLLVEYWGEGSSKTNSPECAYDASNDFLSVSSIF